jgi:hypothetical protein
MSVWHEAQSAESLMCGASTGSYPVTERMIRFRPASIA